MHPSNHTGRQMVQSSSGSCWSRPSRRRVARPVNVVVQQGANASARYVVERELACSRVRAADALRGPYTSTLLVDVGGGKGHDTQTFYTAFGKPSRHDKRKLVLQGLPQVLGAIPDKEYPQPLSKWPMTFSLSNP
ncbi:hypothetical protein P280DRAFT_483708 [Massarina eburnea CBS 473.64]|uniref:O-methyltransferase domain-containing protein n=1 Tax=Massarina eburnea CBS 473.64 TaxID=1395130 RepID=A0A6A6RLF6_9PLEO|nr:hypothetical protein P280DRAFT_483708 [Massarina eburnea CBS 473.64]